MRCVLTRFAGTNRLLLTFSTGVVCYFRKSRLFPLRGIYGQTQLLNLNHQDFTKVKVRALQHNVSVSVNYFGEALSR